MSSHEILTEALATWEYAALVAHLERMAEDAGVSGQHESAEECAVVAVAAVAKTVVQGIDLLGGATVDATTVVVAAVVPAAQRAALMLEMHGQLRPS